MNIFDPNLSGEDIWSRHQHYYTTSQIERLKNLNGFAYWTRYTLKSIILDSIYRSPIDNSIVDPHITSSLWEIKDARNLICHKSDACHPLTLNNLSYKYLFRIKFIIAACYFVRIFIRIYKTMNLLYNWYQIQLQLGIFLMWKLIL